MRFAIQLTGIEADGSVKTERMVENAASMLDVAEAIYMSLCELADKPRYVNQRIIEISVKELHEDRPTKRHEYSRNPAYDGPMGVFTDY